jgi:hypothetical protein
LPQWSALVPTRLTVVAREAWNRLREAYADAWRHRVRSGDAGDGVLLTALERFEVDPTWSGPGAGRDVLLECWHEAVEPRRLRRALMGKVPSLVGAALAPWVEVFRLLRDGEPVDTSWMEMPQGHKALSEARRANDLVLRYLHKRVHRVDLDFTRDPDADELLLGCRAVPPVEDPDWHEAPVWLLMTSEPGQAQVMLGNARLGWCQLRLPAWSALTEEASRGIYADGILPVRGAPDDDATAVVGALRCYVPAT